MKGLIPILAGGFKEQQSLIDSLNQRPTNLEALVSTCCNAPQQNPGNHPTNSTNITLTDNLTIIRDQNQPNPFKVETDIKYTLPQKIKTAFIIYDRTGRVLNKVD